MEARAKLFGHPVHQMLIVFPLGLLGASIVFDIAHLATGNGRWADIAFWMISVGLVSGLLAAVFGYADWRGIPPGTRAKEIGRWHGVGNLVVMLLFAGSWLLRRDAPMRPEVAAVLLSFAGVVLSLFTAWLGGELVDRLGVGVYDDANLDAPSSLTHRSARSP